MDAEKQTVAPATSLLNRICRAFPPLDPNGQPFSMVLRGTAADLADLRSALASSCPDKNARRQLEVELQQQQQQLEDAKSDAGDKFGDFDVEGITQPEEQGDGFPSENTTNAQQKEEEAETECNKKRTRDDEGEEASGNDDEMDSEEDDEMNNQEQLLFYLPSVQCSCSSWNMEDVSGDMFVTTARVLFLSDEKNQDGEEQNDDDVAIDGSCIALHAVDSLPDGENEAKISHHVYCQLAEPMNMGDEGEIGYTSAISMVAPTQIAEEFDDKFNDEEGGEQDAEQEEDDTIEIYFKPTIISDENNAAESEDSQSNQCQSIFDSLTKLASLNPAGDSDEGFNGGGGGLFSMLSLMAGIDGNNGFGSEMVVAGQHDDDSNDDMVVRLGGSNNLVDDDEISEGAPEDERQAMLRRLDDMLVVPPEYEIASSDDGQFDDADEDDDEIL
ncbi:hypothetical protein ACHAXR_007873 [Thalassiosira sp. AJA248-18]